jgi:hypothetical protein
MQARLVVVAALYLFATSIVRADDIGDRLLRTFLVFKNSPLTINDGMFPLPTLPSPSLLTFFSSSAINAGYANISSGCDERFGYGFVENSGGPSRGSSSLFFYTAAGQLSGFGTRAWGSVSDSSIAHGFWRPVVCFTFPFRVVLFFLFL